MHRCRYDTDTHSGILFSHEENEVWSFATMWIMLSEISQTEKQISCGLASMGIF